MQKIYDSVEDLVGNTPLVKLNKLKKKLALKGNLLAKCEFYNPLFSGKDRAALHMINKAPFSKIKNDTVFIEADDGSAGVALAAFCATHGYKLVIVMPEDAPREKVAFIRQFGAEVMFTPAAEGLDGARRKVEILKSRAENLIEFKQFENGANLETHKLTTGAEIMDATGGEVDAVVCKVDTAGTLMGIASTLRSCNPDLYVVAVVQNKAGFVYPPLYNSELVDEVYDVLEPAVWKMAQTVAQVEGLPIGFSSAAALCAGVELAERDEMTDKNIVVVLSDSIESYLSFPQFSSEEQL